MSTTTIRLSDDLRLRIAAAAERAGTSAHSFIIEAISEKIAHEQLSNDFYDVAESRFQTIVASGKTVSWDQMRHYLEDRVAGKKVDRPSPRKLAR